MTESLRIPLFPSVIYLLMIPAMAMGQATVYRVDADAAPGGNGTSWALAFNTLEDAIDAATSFQDPQDQIWVADQTYIPTNTSTGFTIIPAIEIYGGFVGTETMLSQRDPNPVTNGTILSGDLTANVVVTFPSGADLGKLDGFTITGASSHGIKMTNAAPVLENLLIESNGNTNDDGGGIHYSGNDSVAPFFTKCTISANTASAGGGLYFESDGATPEFRECDVEGNEAVIGAGAYVSFAQSTFTDCTFSGNIADTTAGGAYLLAADGTTLEGCRFENNRCTTTTGGDAGGFFNDGSTGEMRRCEFIDNWVLNGNGGGALNSHGDFAYVDCRFLNNFVFVTNSPSNEYGKGGGMYSIQGAKIIDCEFSRNGVTETDENGDPAGGGGAIYSLKTLPQLLNTLFIHNVAYQGGGIYADSSSSASPFIVTNCTFSKNVAEDIGGGVFISSEIEGRAFTNCIFWANTGGGTTLEDQIGFGTSQSVTTFEYCCIEDGNPGTGIPYSATNIDIDPDFIDPDNATYPNFRLAPCSPAIDSANTPAVNTDGFDADDDSDTGEKTPDRDKCDRLFNAPNVTDTGVSERGFDAIVDMGAYEFQSRGDLDKNSTVDGRDIQPFVNCFLDGPDIAEESCHAADVNPDNALDLNDVTCFVNLLLGGEGCVDDCSAGTPRGLVDCNENGKADVIDIADETSEDCNNNFIPDECDLDPEDPDGNEEVSADADADNTPDECEPDCNANGTPDDYDLSEETSADCNENNVPDECEWDCNQNGTPGDCDITNETSDDCNENNIPDECEFDCNDNGVPDDCDIDPTDPDGNTEVSEDCNENGIPDECDLTRSVLPSYDCNNNGTPDECDIANETSEDCNENGWPDECDIALMISEDENENNIPDECEMEMMMMGGGVMASSSESEPPAQTEAWNDFHEWYAAQDWTETTGATRAAAVIEKLIDLNLPPNRP